MIRTPQLLPSPLSAWVTKSGAPERNAFYQYMREVDQAMREMLATINAMTSPVAFASLPAGAEGQIIYVSDGRKNGEGEGLGTGVLGFHDGSGWIAVDTGATLEA